MNKLWYALHVRSNCERLVAEQLDYAGVDAFYPHVKRKSADKRRDVEVKFMPGYVFSRFDLEEKTPVIAIPQVAKILGWGSRPIALPEHEIEGVRMIVTAPNAPEIARACGYIASGERVRVRTGSLAGLEGCVVRLKTGTRVVVSVTMLGRSVAAEVDASTLEPLRPAFIRQAA